MGFSEGDWRLTVGVVVVLLHVGLRHLRVGEVAGERARHATLWWWSGVAGGLLCPPGLRPDEAFLARILRKLGRAAVDWWWAQDGGAGWWGSADRDSWDEAHALSGQWFVTRPFCTSVPPSGGRALSGVGPEFRYEVRSQHGPTLLLHMQKKIIIRASFIS